MKIPRTAPAEGDSRRTEDPVQDFQLATRMLVGIASQSLDQSSGHKVSVAQFRLLAALDELGPVPSSRAATALGLGASSVTRLADRLETSGHLARGRDPANRSVVLLSLTRKGSRLVDRVMASRRRALTRLLEQLDPDEVASTARTLRRLAILAADQEPPPVRGKAGPTDTPHR
jgi:DNA-binding MarR family transcriptional regulator